jgi:hypothetical protein
MLACVAPLAEVAPVVEAIQPVDVASLVEVKPIRGWAKPAVVL